jgi:hypothetical protein
MFADPSIWALRRHLTTLPRILGVWSCPEEAGRNRRAWAGEQACSARLLGLVPAEWFGIDPSAARRHGSRKITFATAIDQSQPGGWR